MLRIDKIRQYVLQCAANGYNGRAGVAADDVALALNIHREDASRDLNELVKRGSLQKTDGKRPVLFFTATGQQMQEGKGQDRPFSRIIGSDGSLRLQVQAAKSAAAYPPHGLHLFIVGDTGVGKTLLAEEIARYMATLYSEREVPFVIFNCAEYADNPQLLLSQLFGYEKGAFTGADSTKQGLFEKADGGILLLDEIHRLPKTGQEMLFTVIDKGKYRQLGSTTDRQVGLMIIGATTENIDSALLDTFKRRIPMLIQIPDLAERPLKERLDLTLLFLSKESSKLSLPITISYETLKYLVSYESKTNIGDLKNEIQICCAQSYFIYLNSVKGTAQDLGGITIERENLSRKLVHSYSPSRNVDSFINRIAEQEYLTVYPDTQLDETTSAVHTKIATDIRYDIISESYLQQAFVDRYQSVHDTTEDNQPAEDALSDSDLLGQISINNWGLATELLRNAATELGEEYSPNAILSLAFQLEQIKLFAKAGRIIANDYSENLTKSTNKGKEYAFVLKSLPTIDNALNVQLMESEVDLLAMLLKQHSVKQKQALRETQDKAANDVNLESTAITEEDSKLIQVVLVTDDIAKSRDIAAFTNQMFNVDMAVALDISDSETDEEILERLIRCVKNIDRDRGVLVLTDISSLFNVGKRIYKKTRIKCHIIPRLDTIVALETGKQVLTSDRSVDIEHVEGMITRMISTGQLFRVFGKRQS
ncbi:sigma 54-interacting transcriptional regulator [Eubacteriales bacterium OttesenSCG-928-N14]|nr:sigma 54-interacting transcriptional regulator [Eubacteriales bacterium OttesenSCG-928-N14]